MPSPRPSRPRQNLALILCLALPSCEGASESLVRNLLVAFLPKATQEAALPGGSGQPPGSSVQSSDSRSAGVTQITETSKRLYYQFVDDQSRVRFVERLAEVPEQWRSQVGYVEMDFAPPLSPMQAQRTRQARYGAPSSAGGSRLGGGAAATELSIVMYSADWCGYCTKAKRYLDREGIAYDERDVDIPAVRAELVEKTGQRGVPVFDVNGRILTGFDPRRLDDLIADAA